MAKELTVAEANQEDVGRSVARIPSQAMDDLNIVPGIEGDDEAVATARRAKQEDQGLDIITTAEDFENAYQTVQATKEDDDAER